MIYPANKPISYYPADQPTQCQNKLYNTNTLYTLNENKPILIYQRSKDEDLELNINLMQNYEDSDDREQRQRLEFI